MKLDTIYERRLHGKIEDLATGKSYDIFTKRVKNDDAEIRMKTDFPKYYSSVKSEGESLGYFYYNAEEDTSLFFGLNVFEGKRGGGMARVFMESYFSICADNNLTFLKTAIQRKPFTAFLLTKLGYVPVETKDNHKFCVLSPTDKRLNISFYNSNIQRNFKNSKIFSLGQYRLGDMENDKIILDNLFYSSHYQSNINSLNFSENNGERRFKISI